MNHIKILFFILFISPLVFSQNEKSPEERAVMQTERFAKELKLSEEQKGQFLIIQTGINQKLEGIRISKMNEDEKRSSLISIRQARLSMLEPILNDEQMKKMAAFDKKKKNKAKKKRANRKKKERKEEKK
jgi:hypothetical protein